MRPGFTKRLNMCKPKVTPSLVWNKKLNDNLAKMLVNVIAVHKYYMFSLVLKYG